MKYLLDTVAFCRALDDTLPGKTRRRLTNADAELLVSIVTPWEIALKRSLILRGLNNDLVVRKIEELGARLLPITLDHTAALNTLPTFPEHRDPFDRMLIAQALGEECPLVSNDSRLSLYEGVGLQVLWD